MKFNQCLNTDWYKTAGIHSAMYPEGTEYVYSYNEARLGAKYDSTIAIGLQAILLEHFVGVQVTTADIDKAEKIINRRGGNFDRSKWDYIVENHGGKLPLEIKAVPEGTRVPIDNVLFTVVNTDPNCAFLTGHVETVLTHVWQASNVATISYNVREMFKELLNKSCDMGEDFPGLPFMLHDFGFRGTSSVESAVWGGMGHLAVFNGTDTVVAIEGAIEYYDAGDDVGTSVNATEHSIMTSMGREGEFDVTQQLLNKFPNGVLSVVSDSFDIFECVKTYGTKFKEQILERDGVFVIRPDSGEPVPTMKALLKLVDEYFGSTVNEKGYKVLNDKVRLIWGDGIEAEGIRAICEMAIEEGFSVENLVFGMGGGLLQKHNRDTQRCAFKSSAQMRNGQWVDIFKDPKDQTKRSKKGRLKLIKDENGEFKTVRLEEPGEDLLRTVFLNGELVNPITFDQIRQNVG